MIIVYSTTTLPRPNYFYYLYCHKFLIYFQGKDVRKGAIFEGIITTVHPSYVVVKISDGQSENHPCTSVPEAKFSRHHAKDIRMPYSLIRKHHPSTRLRIGQNIYLKFLRKDVKNDNDIYIGSTEKINLDGDDDDELSARFGDLEMRDDWTINNRQSLGKDNMKIKKEGINALRFYSLQLIFWEILF